MNSISRGLGLMVALALCALLTTVAHAEIELSGYAQARYYERDSQESKSDEFDLRRVRLKAAGPVNDRGTKAKVQIDLAKLDDPDGSVVLKDAILTHPLSDQWAVRLGYSDVPFGFEVEYSSSKRYPLERSYLAKKLFPGEKDQGIYFFCHPAKQGQPEFAIGYSNGMHEWRKDSKDDDKEASAFTARIQWQLPRKGVAGVSFMTAERTTTFDTSFDADVVGAHVRYNGPSGFNFQGEYYDGERVKVGTSSAQLDDVDGFYAQVEYQRRNSSQATLFYRYDEYNETHGGSNVEDYERHTLGVAWDIAKNDRITLEFEDYEKTKGSDPTKSYQNIALQWQAKY